MPVNVFCQCGNLLYSGELISIWDFVGKQCDSCKREFTIEDVEINKWIDSLKISGERATAEFYEPPQYANGKRIWRHDPPRRIMTTQLGKGSVSYILVCTKCHHEITLNRQTIPPIVQCPNHGFIPVTNRFAMLKARRNRSIKFVSIAKPSNKYSEYLKLKGEPYWSVGTIYR